MPPTIGARPSPRGSEPARMGAHPLSGALAHRLSDALALYGRYPLAAMPLQSAPVLFAVVRLNVEVPHSMDRTALLPPSRALPSDGPCPIILHSLAGLRLARRAHRRLLLRPRPRDDRRHRVCRRRHTRASGRLTPPHPALAAPRLPCLAGTPHRPHRCPLAMFGRYMVLSMCAGGFFLNLRLAPPWLGAVSVAPPRT